jgi:hypothetical protein
MATFVQHLHCPDYEAQKIIRALSSKSYAYLYITKHHFKWFHCNGLKSVSFRKWKTASFEFLADYWWFAGHEIGNLYVNPLHWQKRLCTVTVRFVRIWKQVGKQLEKLRNTQYYFTEHSGCKSRQSNDRPGLLTNKRRRSNSKLYFSTRPWNKAISCNRLWKPVGLWDVEAPTLSR